MELYAVELSNTSDSFDKEVAVTGPHGVVQPEC